MAESQVLKKLDSPAYCIKVLENGLIAIAGGGGTSKTGVGNLIELGLIHYEINNKLNGTVNYDGQAKFKSIHTFEPEDAIMKFVSFTIEEKEKTILKKDLKIKQKIENQSEKNGENEKTSKTNKRPAKFDMFLAAAVNDSVEIYKLSPKLQTSHLNYNGLDMMHLNNKKGYFYLF
jgi:hypothetical protein